MEVSSVILEIPPKLGLGLLRFGKRPKKVISIMDDSLADEDWMYEGGGPLDNTLRYHHFILWSGRTNGDDTPALRGM